MMMAGDSTEKTPEKRNRKDSFRKALLGGGAILGTLVFLAIIVAIQYIAMKNPKRWDLTETGKYTLAPQSKKVVESFQDKGVPIDIIAFYETKDFGPRKRTKDLLNQYKDAYPKLTYSFVDPDKELAVAKRQGIDSYPSLVIKAGDKKEIVTKADEETVTNALVKLLRSEVKKIYFLKGHGEFSPKETEGDGMSIAKRQIEKQNYVVDELVLLQTPSVPKDATILVIAGPEIDPTESELKSVKDYLDSGGKMLALLRPFKTPKLCEFLKPYGFETSDDIIVDRMSRAVGGDYLMPLITSYADFPITKGFNLASFFPEARSVAVPKKPVPDVVAKELALTSPVSWSIDEEQLKSGQANFDPAKGKKGPLSVMAVSTYTNFAAMAKSDSEAKEKKKPTVAKDKQESAEPEFDEDKGGKASVKAPPKARLVVFGSAQFASNKFFRLQGNGDLFMNTVSWLAEEENLIAIRPKASGAKPVIMTSAQSMLTFIVPVVLLPLFWAVLGAVVFFYRKWSAAGQ